MGLIAHNTGYGVCFFTDLKTKINIMENTFENALDYVHHLDQIDGGWSESEKTLASAMMSYAAKVVKNCSIPVVVRSVFTIHSTEDEGIVKIVGTEDEAKQQVEEFKKQHSYADFFYEKQNVS